MRYYRALFTLYRADMPEWVYPEKMETFQAIDAVRFLVVNLPAFPSQLNMDAWAAITYQGFRNFQDKHCNRPIMTPTLKVVYGSALHQQTTSLPNADAISFSQKMYRLALLSRPQNFCLSTFCSISLSWLRSATSFSAADFHPPTAGVAVIPLRPDR